MAFTLWVQRKQFTVVYWVWNHGKIALKLPKVPSNLAEKCLWRSSYYFTDGASHTGCWSTNVCVGHNPIDSIPTHHCHSEHILGIADLFTSYRLVVHWSWCWYKTWWQRTQFPFHSIIFILAGLAFSISPSRSHVLLVPRHTFSVPITKFYTKPLQSISPNLMANKISRFTYSTLQLPAVAILTVLCYSP